MAKCPVFKNVRNKYAKSFSDEATGDLFDTLPDCTVKSAWITIGADESPERRVDLQIAVANLGLDILFSPEETLRGMVHWTTQQEVDKFRKAAEEGAENVTGPAPPLIALPACLTELNSDCEDAE